MAKYSKKQPISEQTQDEAMTIALGTQKPGQTKEQTKLIAKGIEKGIAQYKKRQKEKAREQNKKHRKESTNKLPVEPLSADSEVKPGRVTGSKLPWVLLALSWIGFAAYFFTAV